ncbi:MAG: cobyrinate a,c-diamide synthase [Treponema sp.]|nr:cobyrinate a,c-diamide synthase [Treponema sp.]
MNADLKSQSQILNAPRVMIAAPSSSSGKTTLTCALLALLKNRGNSPVAFKCGPDFIDPMFHERVLGVPSTNLDSYFVGDDEVRKIFAENYARSRADCAVIEGVMGLFDGLAGKSIQASSYDIARITGTPILLVVDASGASRSIVPLVQGFLDYDKKNSCDGKNLIKGVFLNKCSKAQFSILKPLIEEECVVADENGETRVKVLGFLPNDSESVWKSRHLGLFLPQEIAYLNKQIKKTAKILTETLDFAELEEIMMPKLLRVGDFKGLCPLGEGVAKNAAGGWSEGKAFPHANSTLHTANFSLLTSHSSLTIAVARDEAFCFYYQENLRALEEAGAHLVFFSPLHDACVPSEARGILLGGGYPELHAAELEANDSMRKSIKAAVKNGVAVMAECGGFMYLQEKLVTESGEAYEMCGAIEGECRYTGKLVRFGYAEFTPKDAKNAGGQGVCHAERSETSKTQFSVRGHEFHYFDSTNNGSAFSAKKPLSSRSWDCMIHTEKMLAGFPHLYYRSCPEIVRWFVGACGK